MLVKDIMTKAVVWVGPEEKVTEVAKLMWDNRFHGIPVVKDKKVIGLVTETDFFIKSSVNLYLPSYIQFLKEIKINDEIPKDKEEQVKKLLDAKAEDIMSKNCVTVLQDLKVEDLLNFFKETKFTTLPVVDENNDMVGIITLADVIHLIKI